MVHDFAKICSFFSLTASLFNATFQLCINADYSLSAQNVWPLPSASASLQLFSLSCILSIILYSTCRPPRQFWQAIQFNWLSRRFGRAKIKFSMRIMLELDQRRTSVCFHARRASELCVHEPQEQVLSRGRIVLFVYGLCRLLNSILAMHSCSSRLCATACSMLDTTLCFTSEHTA